MSETVNNSDLWVAPLPRAVREQVERANVLAREAGIANVPPPPQGAEPPVTSGVTLGDTEIPPEFQADAPTEAGLTEVPPQSTEVGEGQGGLVQAPPSPGDAPPANWEARYNTLQGKYNSEVPELRAQLAALRETIQAMQYRERSPGDLPAAPPPVPRAQALEIPPTDVENYGSDLIQASQRWAEAKYAPVLSEYERRLAAVEGNTRQLGQLSMTQRVEAALDGAVARWRDINANDPVWDDWLNQTDVFSGRPRKQLITEAYQAGDAPRTIAFFQSYLREQTAVTPPPQPGTRQYQTGSGAMSAGPATPTPLEMLAVPGRGPVSNPAYPASGAQNGVNGTRRSWTGAEITAFYNQVQRGLWRGREAEVAAIEADISRSGLDGRYNA